MKIKQKDIVNLKQNKSELDNYDEEKVCLLPTDLIESSEEAAPYKRGDKKLGNGYLSTQLLIKFSTRRS